MKELSDVGKDLPTKAGDSEANRDKNRYPYILPCKCKLLITQVIMHIGAWFCFSLPTVDHCRVRLSVQNFFPHSDYINANYVPVSVGSVFLMFCLCLLKPVVFVFRVEDRRETSSAPRGLCRAPWPTSGGWCGSKTSGWSSWWRLWGTNTRWGRRSCSVSKPLQTLSAALRLPSGCWDRRRNPQWPATEWNINQQRFNGWIIKYLYLFACRCCVKNTGPQKEAQFIMEWCKWPRWAVNKAPITLSPALTSDRWDDGAPMDGPLHSSRLSRLFRVSERLLWKAACVNGTKENFLWPCFRETVRHPGQ